MEYDYVGWVPTIVGRLSFSIAGHTSHPTRAIYENVADTNDRYLLCYQKRRCLDSSIPIFKALFSSAVLGQKSDFRFLCVAKAKNSAKVADADMHGDIYLFYKHKNYFVRDDKSKGWCAVEADIKNMQRELSETASRDLTNLSNQFDIINPKIQALGNQFALLKVSFTLKRNGIVYFSFPNEEKLIEMRRSLTNFSSCSPQIKKTICAQFYFFLKDLVHTHQHHHPTTDTIIDLHENIDDRWIYETIRGLYRRVLSFKRSKDSTSYLQARGVLTYIKAFHNVMRDELDENHHLLAIDNPNIEDSIQISEAKEKLCSEKTRSNRTVFLTSLLSLIGLSASSVIVVNIVKPDSLKGSAIDSLVEPVKYLANHPGIFIFLLLFVPFLFRVWVDNHSWKRISWLQDVTRLAVNLKRSQVAFFLVFIPLIILLSMIYFFFF